MKRLIYQVYVGGKKSNLYETCIESARKYCEKYGIDHIVQTKPILRIRPDIFTSNRSEESYMKYGGYLPIYEKENAFKYFDRYDQIAIIDADIFIKDKSFTKYLKGQSPQQFLKRYEFQRFVDGLGSWKWSTDQTLLNWWIKKEKMNVKHLDWKFNALYTAVDENKITDAHFIHFFLKDKLPLGGENVEQLLKQIGVNDARGI